MVESEQRAGGPKKVRRRSREHPKVPAGECVELAAKVREYGGRMGVEDYAKELGYSSHTSGGVIAKISSPRYFGFLTRDKNELRATDLLERVLVPLDEAELREAKLQAVDNVEIYKELIEAIGRTGVKKYEVVKNLAQRKLGIEAGAADEFVRTFVESMEWAGLGRSVDDNSFELLDKPVGSAGVVAQEQAGAPAPAELVPPKQHPEAHEMVKIRSPQSLPIQLHFHLNGLTADEIKDIIQATVAVLNEA